MSEDVQAPPQQEANQKSPETNENVKSEDIAESEDETEIEFDMTGCVDPDETDESQNMGNPSKEVSEEEMEKADGKRIDAVQQLLEGNIEKAVELLTEAIELNPNSALLFAKRGQAYLKLTKPNACIKDCTRALEINCDSAMAFKFRGRAYRLLGMWELAAKDLRQACNIDFDEQTDEWLREVTPNAKKIEERVLKLERKKKENAERERLERIRKAREAHAAEGGSSMGAEGMPHMNEFYKLLQDPEITAAFRDPEVAAAFQDLSTNPTNFMKYQANPKVMNLIMKLSNKFSEYGMDFPEFPGLRAGNIHRFQQETPQATKASTGDNPQTAKPTDDDNLD